MRALVTGGLGFVGQHLVRHLRERGDDVVTIDRHGSSPVDITDSRSVTDAITAAEPEAVYHLAGWADVGASWKDPVAVFEVNAVGTLHVLQASVQAGVERVLAVGSAELYGIVSPADLPLTEDAPLRPTSPYGASKAAAEALAQQAHLGYGLAVIRVRPFNHVGPGQSEHFVASALAARIARAELEGSSSIPVGNLSARRDLTDVRDIVRAYRLLVEHGTPGDVYNVCSGRDLSVQEVAEQLISLARRPMALEPDPDLMRPVDLPVLRGDPRRLNAATGWAPEIPIERSLLDLLDDMRARAGAPTEARAGHR